ncbi:hypothetical protein RB195_012911 [Necator americanus]|uniref:Uncharacterized protein n=1 Tax=Necator americanus TaxID=51031 RepID=A0ABR1DT45_NECAM
MGDVEPLITISTDDVNSSGNVEKYEGNFDELDDGSKHKDDEVQEPLEDTASIQNEKVDENSTEPVQEFSAQDEETNENGTEETVDIEDKGDQTEMEGNAGLESEENANEPPVTFDQEPADKAPVYALPQQQVQRYDVDSDADSLTGLERPDFSVII